jgi:hypothetical protein
MGSGLLSFSRKFWARNRTSTKEVYLCDWRFAQPWNSSDVDDGRAGEFLRGTESEGHESLTKGVLGYEGT